MNMKILCLLALSLLSVCYAKQVCYGDLGCFIDTQPFSGVPARPLALLPESPDKVGAKFTLFTRQNRQDGVVIRYDTLSQLYKPELRTKFITHGFLHNANKKWVVDMKDALLRVEDQNVITVDWSKGNGFPYTQATANTQIVGAEIARLVNSMIANKGAKAADFHLIGHSLGAHISGYAGSRIKNLGRITGLDPAGPYFENTDPVVRLDPSDAVYVDAIHSDGAATLQIGLGLMQQVGHADYYPNGGKVQPNCPQTSDKLLGAIFNLITLDVNSIEESVGCNHQAAVTYFQESIENANCQYTAFPCDTKDNFDNGKCLTCSTKGCNRMGYWSDPAKQSGSLFLKTDSPLKNTYCMQNFRVKLVSNSKYNQARGTFKISFKTSNGEQSKQFVLDDSETTFKSGSTNTKLLSIAETRVNNAIDSVFISYTKTTNFLSGWLYDSSWGFSSIEVFSGDDQFNTKFCPTSDTVQSAFVEFKRC